MHLRLFLVGEYVSVWGDVGFFGRSTVDVAAVAKSESWCPWLTADEAAYVAVARPLFTCHHYCGLSTGAR